MYYYNARLDWEPSGGWECSSWRFISRAEEASGYKPHHIDSIRSPEHCVVFSFHKFVEHQ